MCCAAAVAASTAEPTSMLALQRAHHSSLTKQHIVWQPQTAVHHGATATTAA
jgi:hypothetical protein